MIYDKMVVLIHDIPDGIYRVTSADSGLDLFQTTQIDDALDWIKRDGAILSGNVTILEKGSIKLEAK